jgi:hypothetical protein
VNDLVENLEPDEKVLWKIILPAKNLIFKKQLYMRLFSTCLAVFIPLNLFLITGSILKLTQYGWFQFYFAIDIALTLVIPFVIYLFYRDEKNIYEILSTHYLDDELRDFHPYYAITNKYIIMKWISEMPYEFSPKQEEMARNYAFFRKSVLFLNHAFLEKIRVSTAFRIHAIDLDFGNNWKSGPQFAFDLKDETDLKEFLAAIKSVNGSVSIIKR